MAQAQGGAHARASVPGAFRVPRGRSQGPGHITVCWAQLGYDAKRHKEFLAHRKVWRAEVDRVGWRQYIQWSNTQYIQWSMVVQRAGAPPTQSLNLPEICARRPTSPARRPTSRRRRAREAAYLERPQRRPLSPAERAHRRRRPGPSRRGHIHEV